MHNVAAKQLASSPLSKAALRRPRGPWEYSVHNRAAPRRGEALLRYRQRSRERLRAGAWLHVRERISEQISAAAGELARVPSGKAREASFAGQGELTKVGLC